MGFARTSAGKTLHLSTNRAHHVMETGDDLRAIAYSEARPFKTIQACFDNAYEDGDIIMIWPGFYDYESDIEFDGKGGDVTHVHLHYMENAIVSLDTNGQQYILTPVDDVQYHIHGRGDFLHSGTFTGSTVVFFSCADGDSTFWIHGARTIQCAQGNPMSIHWAAIENVDLIETGNWYAIYATTENPLSPRNGRDIGYIRNVKMARGFEAGIGLNNPATEHVLIENCNFEAYAGGGFAMYSDTSDHRATWVNCTFLNDDNRCAYMKGYEIFQNCKFQNGDAALECVKVDDTGVAADYNNYRPVFENCWFRADGGAVAILTQGPALFTGVNRAYGEDATYKAIRGYQEADNIIHGVLIVNDETADPSAQVWQLILGTDPPTVGETYTITAPDTTTIDYLVVALDTRTDVANGLVAAWATQAIGDPTGDFAKYTPVALVGPTYGVQATAIDPNDNFDPDNGFVPTTDGADSFTSIYPLTEGFSWSGTGNFEVDENLFVGLL